MSANSDSNNREQSYIQQATFTSSLRLLCVTLVMQSSHYPLVCSGTSSPLSLLHCPGRNPAGGTLSLWQSNDQRVQTNNSCSLPTGAQRYNPGAQALGRRASGEKGHWSNGKPRLYMEQEPVLGRESFRSDTSQRPGIPTSLCRSLEPRGRCVCSPPAAGPRSAAGHPSGQPLPQ